VYRVEADDISERAPLREHDLKEIGRQGEELAAHLLGLLQRLALVHDRGLCRRFEL
jgi:hypothetical protein